jgi:hypothetical protein
MIAENPRTQTTENDPVKLDRYPGIRPFSKSQAILFYGRNAELNELLNSVKAYPLFVLHSKSGLGKTSLLNAGLMPLLEKEGYLPIEIRFRFTNISGNGEIKIPDPFEAIEEACKPVADKDAIAAIKPQYKTLWIYLKLLKNRHQAPVLVFDQFEEFFSHPDKKRKDQIIMQFAELLNDRPPAYIFDFIKDHKDIVGTDESFFLEPSPAHILFSIRSDKLALLDEMKTLIPSITNKRFQLNPLFAAQAKQAILLPASLINFGTHTFRKVPFEYDGKALETILKVLQDKANSAEIESTQLQIICQSIEKKIPEAGDDAPQEVTITEDTFNGEEGLRSILQNFYEDQLTALSEMKDITIYDMERVREMIETKMLFEEIRVGLLKKQVLNSLQDVEMLNDEAERIKKAESIIGALIDLRIIRSEETYLGITYIITHDTLIRPIIESHKQELEKKEQSAQRSLTEVFENIDNFSGVDHDKVMEFFATRMIVDGKRQLLTEDELIAGMAPAGLDETRARRIITYGTRKNFFRPGQTNNQITYQLANERLADLIQKEYNTVKTFHDNLRLKEEKEKLQKLTAENKRLANIIGAGVIVLMAVGMFFLIYFKRQADANRAVLSRNFNYEAERSYSAGYQVLAYALWKKAREYAPNDTVIQSSLKNNEFHPYAGFDIQLSDSQQYIATRNGNKLNIWKDGEENIILAKSIDNIQRYTLFSDKVYIQDTAGGVHFFDLATGKDMKLSNDLISLDSVQLRKTIASVKILPGAIRVYTGQPSYLYYFWNYSGLYLENISTYCNITDTVVNLSDANRLDENTMIIARDESIVLFDVRRDVIIPLGKIEKGMSLEGVKQLSAGYYSLLMLNSELGKYKVIILNLPVYKIVYASPLLSSEPIVTSRRVISKTSKGVQVYNFMEQGSYFVPLTDANTSWIHSQFDDDKVSFVKVEGFPVTKVSVYTSSVNDIYQVGHIAIPDTIVNPNEDIHLNENYLVFRTAKKNLYVYNLKDKQVKQLASYVTDFTPMNNHIIGVYSYGKDFYVNVETGNKISVHTDLDMATLLPPKFILESEKEDKLMYIDSTKNDIDSLFKRYKPFIEDRFETLGLPGSKSHKAVRKTE